MNEVINTMSMQIPAKSENESFARAVVAAFCVGLNPTIDEISDIKTAVSEAVTNCVVHAYQKRQSNDDMIHTHFMEDIVKGDITIFNMSPDILTPTCSRDKYCL